MTTKPMDALVIFGATGDLAKLAVDDAAQDPGRDR